MRKFIEVTIEYIILSIIVGGITYAGASTLRSDMKDVKESQSRMETNIQTIADLLECDLSNKCK